MYHDDVFLLDDVDIIGCCLDDNLNDDVKLLVDVVKHDAGVVVSPNTNTTSAVHGLLAFIVIIVAAPSVL